MPASGDAGERNDGRPRDASFVQIVPSLRIRSYEEAVAFYVSWLPGGGEPLRAHRARDPGARGVPGRSRLDAAATRPTPGPADGSPARPMGALLVFGIFGFVVAVFAQVVLEGYARPKRSP